MEKTVNVKVIPKAKFSQVLEDLEGNLQVRVTAPPVKGQENSELIKLLADYYKVSKSNIEIIRGLRERKKVIKIQS